MKSYLLPLLAAASLAAADVPPPAAPPEQVLQVPEPGRFKRLFQPFSTDIAALSPDGKYLAYSMREGESLSVIVVEIDHPEVMKSKVKVIDDEAATPMLAENQAEKTPGRINWMRWVTPTRVVVETNQVFAGTSGAAGNWQSWRGAVFGFDADGRNAKLLAGPRDLPEASDQTGFPEFSSGRNAAGPSALPPTPDQAARDPLQGTDPTAAAVFPQDDGSAQPPVNFGASQPRTFHVFDFDPQRPGAITLVATGATRSTGSRSVSFYSLDTQTGKLTALTDDLLRVNETPLLDRQGRARLTLPNTLLSRFPFAYEYLGPKGRGRGQPLNAATGLSGFAVSPDNYFGERAIPLGFDENPNILYYAANTGRDTYGIYSFDLAAKKRGSIAMENPSYDLIAPPQAGFPDQNLLVFDRHTHGLIGVRYENALRTTAWLHQGLQGLQTEMERRFAGRTVEISEWDEAGRRFLLSTEGPADPGAFYVFDAKTSQLQEFVRRAPWIDATQVHVTLPFSYAMPDGARISGLVTVPRHPRLKPIPMVVICPELPWQRVQSGFQSEVQALADMGFAIVQLNGRGAWGLGLKQRQSLTAGYDLVQVEDIATSVSQLEKIFHVNTNRVALLGRGHGGFIALRTLQAHPDKFRCAIALDAPVDLAGWLAEQRWSGDTAQPHLTRAWLGDAARLKAAPLTSQPGAITKPVLMLNYPGPEGAPHRTAYAVARRFGAEVARAGTTVEFDELRTDYMRGLPAARAEVFDRIEQFLNVHVYDFKVKVNDFKIIK